MLSWYEQGSHAWTPYKELIGQWCIGSSCSWTLISCLCRLEQRYLTPLISYCLIPKPAYTVLSEVSWCLSWHSEYIPGIPCRHSVPFQMWSSWSPHELTVKIGEWLRCCHKQWQDSVVMMELSSEAASRSAASILPMWHRGPTADCHLFHGSEPRSWAVTFTANVSWQNIIRVVKLQLLFWSCLPMYTAWHAALRHLYSSLSHCRIDVKFQPMLGLTVVLGFRSNRSSPQWRNCTCFALLKVNKSTNNFIRGYFCEYLGISRTSEVEEVKSNA